MPDGTEKIQAPHQEPRADRAGNESGTSQPGFLLFTLSRGNPMDAVSAFPHGGMPITEAILSRVLPLGWTLVAGGTVEDDGAKWVNRSLGLTVIESLAVEQDARRWHHVSLSRRSRTPSWEDMTLAHRLFIGEDVEAYQVHVPKSRWISIHPFCLHLWACLDAPDGALPDFARSGRSI